METEEQLKQTGSEPRPEPLDPMTIIDRGLRAIGDVLAYHKEIYGNAALTEFNGLATVAGLVDLIDQNLQALPEITVLPEWQLTQLRSVQQNWLEPAKDYFMGERPDMVAGLGDGFGRLPAKTKTDL